MNHHSYEVAFEDQALKQLAKLDKPVRMRIFRTVRELAVDPRPAGSIPLKGDTDAWRVRVGDYRVVYTVHDGRLLVLVLSVAHRREVYRDL
ncbi:MULTISPECIES: type II toxin-antitoxin system RelE family toxin [Nocardiopsidaceae]|uniref:Type II toxin-antitoxin system RelE/ParE family toxin n=2 Tax=Nocardiopsidaceae TaxID=83676 RepID=A0ABY6YTI5_9ACTN|nr:type II toxin-antitoxin system RelE/ParE family toxin [Streptomonospora nanhaiensis]WAE75713.1 type II toxin-antitoxin system RelE/ParE family toxin [Streptomonospora nanhaiensis]